MEDERILNTPEEQLQWMKNKYKQVKKAVDDMETYLENFESIRAKLDDEDDGLETNFERVKDKKTEIDTLYSEANQTVQTLKNEIAAKSDELNTVKLLLTSAKQSSEDCQSLKNEISSLKTSSKSNDTAINNLLTKSQTNSNNIDSLLKKAETDIQNIQGFLATFNNLRGQIEDKENGFETIIGKVKENMSESDGLLGEIRGILSKSNKNLTEIENEKKRVQDNSKKVEELTQKSKQDYSEIKRILGISTDAMFSDSFNKRKLEHENNAEFRKGMFIGAIILLLVILIIMFWGNIFKGQGIPTVSFTIFRVSLTSPLLFGIRFCGTEYSKSRTNEEKYAFKFASASTFRNHIEFLLENFGEDKKGEVLETAQKIIDMLYTPTYPSGEKLSKTEKEILKDYTNNKKGKSYSKKNIDEILNTLQKVKEVVGLDQETLKSIILSILIKQ